MSLNGAITPSVITIVTNQRYWYCSSASILSSKGFSAIVTSQAGNAWDVFAFGYLWRLAASIVLGQQYLVAPHSIARQPDGA
jgi:hypothetical protein